MSQPTNEQSSITVEVAFALPDKQKIITLNVAAGTTAQQAVELSNIGQFFPEEDIAGMPLGIFGQALGTKGMPPADSYELKSRDRVEIYRPLIADPKEVRRQRAEKAKMARAQS